MDDLDEESVQLGGKRSFFTGPLADYRWRALLPQTVSADERMTRFARGIELLGDRSVIRGRDQGSLSPGQPASRGDKQWRISNRKQALGDVERNRCRRSRSQRGQQGHPCHADGSKKENPSEKIRQ